MYQQKQFTGSDGSIITVGDSNYPDITMQTLDVTGNWRVTNVVDNHNVQHMREDYKGSTDPKTTTIILGVLLGISVLLAIILGVCACKQMRALQEEKFQTEGGEREEIEL